jgi:putative ABC transport system permease protein
LKLAPALGRPFTAQDNASELPQVALLTHDYWERQFAGDAAVLGSMMSIDGLPVQIVGVLDSRAKLPEQLEASDASPIDVWLPLWIDPSEPARNHHVFRSIARLKNGVALASAQSELTRLTRQLPEALPTAYSERFMRETGFSTEVLPLRDDVVGGIARVLWILFASVGIVLLIAAANVANLYVARVEARRKEIGIRAALGADSARVLRHFLVEGMLIALFAGAVALALAHAAIRVLVTLSPAGIPRLSEVHVGVPTILFTAALCVAASGLLALLAIPHRDSAMEALQQAGRGTTASRRQRAFRGALLVAQVALSLVVLASAALLFQSFRRLVTVNPGIDPRGVVTFDVALPSTRYASFDAGRAFYENLETQLRALPGVRAVGATEALPLTGNDGCSGITVTDPEPGAENAACLPIAYTTPGYFSALGITVRGRALEWSDARPGSSAVVVSGAVAARLWPGRDPIGRRLGGGPDTDHETFTVVGVASDVLGSGLDKAPIESIYFPMSSSLHNNMGNPRRMTFALAVKTSHPEEMIPAVRRVLAGIDPEVPASHIATMDDVIARSTARTSFSTLLLGLAALIALLLCAIGIYGITSYLVMQRSAEIGIRMALGARRSEVGRLVVMHSVKLAGLGVGIGLLGAFFVTRLLGSQLFHVSPTDPVTLAAVSVFLVVLALIATYAPARRAMRVDPVSLLHD